METRAVNELFPSFSMARRLRFQLQEHTSENLRDMLDRKLKEGPHTEPLCALIREILAERA